MKEREWNPGLIERTGAFISYEFFSKFPGLKRKILEEQEGKGGLGKVRVFYRGEEVEVVRKPLFSSCRKNCRRGPSYLAIRPRGEPLKPLIPLSRKVVSEIQLLIREER